jgi:phage terminase large subunit-like protein
MARLPILTADPVRSFLPGIGAVLTRHLRARQVVTQAPEVVTQAPDAHLVLPDTDRRVRWHAVGQPGAGRPRNPTLDKDERSNGQFMPTAPFYVWLILAGRGWGKDLSGSNAVLDMVESRKWNLFGIAAPTAGDLRSVMIEGPTGILACSDPAFRPHYEPSKRYLTWPNGARALLFSADQPDRFRGPNLDGFWAGELAAYKNLGEIDSTGTIWSNIGLMTRIGHPQIIITTTPKPLKLLRQLMARPSTIVTRGHTYENRANLAAEFIANVVEPLEGTRLGRQELAAELLEDVPGALWTWGMIADHRVERVPAHRVQPPNGEDGEWWEEEIDRVVVGLDPSVTATSASDECGIIGVKRGLVRAVLPPQQPEPAHFYVVEDWSGIMPAAAWARSAATLMDEIGGDRLVAEVNNGGDLVESTLRGANINLPVRKVHAAINKMARAEPVAALYEQARVHHVAKWDPKKQLYSYEHLAKLEAEMQTYTGKRGEASPNRLDGLVWALYELASLSAKAPRHYSFARAAPRPAQ